MADEQPRAIVLVLDSVGVRRAARRRRLRRRGIEHARQHGARRRRAVRCRTSARWGSATSPTIAGVAAGRVRRPRRWGTQRRGSAGKDTTTGHWEMMGLQLDHAVPDVPGRLPARGHGGVRRARPGSGGSATTRRAAPRSSRSSVTSTSRPASRSSTRARTPCSRSRRTRTSSRSRSSTAICAIARERVLVGEHAVGRVIARPFVGPTRAARTCARTGGATSRVEPFEPTVLDSLTERGVACYGIGKIGEIFAWQRRLRVAARRPTTWTGSTKLVDASRRRRRRASSSPTSSTSTWCGATATTREGYARGLEAVDARMPELLDAMGDGDLLIVTADHGCDPTTAFDRPQPRVHAAHREGEGRRRGRRPRARARRSPTSARPCSTSTACRARADAARRSSRR